MVKTDSDRSIDVQSSNRIFNGDAQYLPSFRYFSFVQEASEVKIIRFPEESAQ